MDTTATDLRTPLKPQKDTSERAILQRRIKNQRRELKRLNTNLRASKPSGSGSALPTRFGAGVNLRRGSMWNLRSWITAVVTIAGYETGKWIYYHVSVVIQ